MRVSRLYVSSVLGVGQQLVLDEESAHYLRTVLRLKPDAEIVLFNGSGSEYPARLTEVSKKAVRVNVLEKHERDVESSLTVNFGLGISRGDRMDWAVQKAVELGVNSITPLMTSRCNVVLKNDKEQQKQQHWQKIVQHACEQSGRCFVPTLNPVTEFTDWVSRQQGLRIFLDPHAQLSLKNLQPEQGSVTLLSGPEGGFTDEERKFAQYAGFTPVSLGKRILRTETAALAALAAVQTLWGDFA